MQTKVSGAALVLGTILLWPVPLGGALLLVAGSIGLAIAWEDKLPAPQTEIEIDLTDRGAEIPVAEADVPLGR